MARTFRTNRKTRTVFPLRGGLSSQSSLERQNPIEYHQRRIRDIEYKMPAPILGVFAPDSPAHARLALKREELVNVYRQVWGSNAGLSTEHLNQMSERDLDESIRSLRRMLELPR